MALRAIKELNKIENIEVFYGSKKMDMRKVKINIFATVVLLPVAIYGLIGLFRKDIIIFGRPKLIHLYGINAIGGSIGIISIYVSYILFFSKERNNRRFDKTIIIPFIIGIGLILISSFNQAGINTIK